MKKTITTIALSMLLFSCKQENKTVKTEEIKKTENENIVYKKIIENEKIEEFTVSLFQGKDELEGKVELRKNGTEKPYTYFFKMVQQFVLTKDSSAESIVSFEDFNFDGEKEIVINGDWGIYIYDRKTGMPKNLFKEENDSYCTKGTKNYIFTDRGSYEKNEKEKTITITGANSAASGKEDIYKIIENKEMKLVKESKWDYWNGLN